MSFNSILIIAGVVIFLLMFMRKKKSQDDTTRPSADKKPSQEIPNEYQRMDHNGAGRWMDKRKCSK